MIYCKTLLDRAYVGSEHLLKTSEQKDAYQKVFFYSLLGEGYRTCLDIFSTIARDFNRVRMPDEVVPPSLWFEGGERLHLMPKVTTLNGKIIDLEWVVINSTDDVVYSERCQS